MVVFRSAKERERGLIIERSPDWDVKRIVLSRSERRPWTDRFTVVMRQTHS
jgi:hypothetical protein